jgi:Flp pilus assembly protein CpaB
VTLSPSSKLREAGSPKPARRRSGRWPSASHLLIAVVVILAFVLNLLVLQDRSSTTLVAVADQPLTTGSVFDASAIRLVPVDSEFEGLATLVEEDDLTSFEGRVLNRAIPEGGLVDRQALVEPATGAGLRSMSLPIPVEHAAGGALQPGDRVDVIMVREGIADYVATDLEVTGVADLGSGAIGAASQYHVVVAVSAEEALVLAEAIASESIEIVRATGVAAAGKPASP